MSPANNIGITTFFKIDLYNERSLPQVTCNLKLDEMKKDPERIHKIRVSPDLPDGNYQFYFDGYPMRLNWVKGKPIDLILLFTRTLFGGFNFWTLNKTALPKEMVFIDNHDVLQDTLVKISETQREQKKAREESFATCRNRLLEVGFSENFINKIVDLAPKNTKISTLDDLSRRISRVSPEEVKKVEEFLKNEEGLDVISATFRILANRHMEENDAIGLLTMSDMDLVAKANLKFGLSFRKENFKDVARAFRLCLDNNIFPKRELTQGTETYSMAEIPGMEKLREAFKQ